MWVCSRVLNRVRNVVKVLEEFERGRVLHVCVCVWRGGFTHQNGMIVRDVNGIGGIPRLCMRVFGRASYNRR